MKTIVYKQRGLILRNPSPLLMAILKIQKLREPYVRWLIDTVLKDGAERIDKAMMEINT